MAPARVKNPSRVFYSGTTNPKSHNPNRKFITVEVYMPHLARYGKPVRQVLTYGATFDVYPGMWVLCPPTRLSGRWMKGKVISVDDGGWRGRVKYVAQMGKKKK